MSSQTRVAVCDAETDPFKHGRVPLPFVWGFYDGRDYDSFWGEDELATEFLLEHLYEYPSKLTLYAHNGGKFDFFYFLKYFDKDSIRLINGRISQASLFDGKIQLRDSFNIIPVPQKVFGKDDIEYWKMEKEYRNKYRPEILSYLQTDCLELYGIVDDFIDRYGKKLTLATAAMKDLKETVELKARRSFEPMSEIQDDRFRPYYYGGRCEAFRKGELKPEGGKFYIYDIKSAYPFAMLHEHPDPTYNSFYVDHKFPKHTHAYFAHIRAISRGALPWRLPKYDDLTMGDMEYCVENNISLKRSEYPVNKLCFPNDNRIRDYFITGWEIQAGLDTKTLIIKDIIKVRIPDKTINFEEFVLKHYEEKNQAKIDGRARDELFAKLFLNSSYGKLALNPRTFKEYDLVDHGELPAQSNDDKNPYIWKLHSSYPEYDLDIYERPKHIPKEFYENEDDYIQCRGFYNVATAASITGFVRAYLWRHIHAAKNPIYCDTDSIFCESFRGEEGKNLGQWECEGWADRAWIGGKKNYALRIQEGKGVQYYKSLHYTIDNEIMSRPVTVGRRWKMATKGSRLRAWEIVNMVRNKQTIEWENAAPTFSLRRGTQFLKREVRMT